jgi:hypothetical protein
MVGERVRTRENVGERVGTWGKTEKIRRLKTMNNVRTNTLSIAAMRMGMRMRGDPRAYPVLPAA